MSRDLVIGTLFDIMHRNFPSVSDDIEMKADVKLTSSEIGLNDMELYELMMCIEERFSLYFVPQEVRDNGFDTINKVCDLVCEVLSR